MSELIRTVREHLETANPARVEDVLALIREIEGRDWKPITDARLNGTPIIAGLKDSPLRAMAYFMGRRNPRDAARCTTTAAAA